MKKATLLLFLFSGYLSFSQKRTGYSRLYPSFTVQNYFDQNSIKYDGRPPEGHIHAKNTIGYNWGLQYERITRYGLVLGTGLQYGRRHYDISIKQDMSDFDSTATNNLKGVLFNKSTKVSVNYWTFLLLSGYRLKLNQKMAIIGKTGVSLRLFYDGNWDKDEYMLSYLEDNNFTRASALVTKITNEFGRDPAMKKSGFIGRNRFPEGVLSYEIYVGIERSFDSAVIKNFSIGVEGCRSWFMWPDTEEMTIWTSRSFTNILNSKEVFYDRNISLGLRVAVGLWR